MRLIHACLAVVFAGLIAVSLWHLEGARAGLEIERTSVGDTPVSVFRAEGAGRAPVVLIAHGFAGSQQLMEPFAMTLARAGYLAVTFDWMGHGRHPAPMTGDVTAIEGTTEVLLDQMEAVAAFALALPGADGRLAILGHSMASDLVVRYAARDPRVEATVAVSLFSRAVTADHPRNLLVVTGEYEPGLVEEALRVARLTDPAAGDGVTVGDRTAGTARRAVLADGVEHIGVLYSAESLAETRDWLDAVFAGAGAKDAAGAVDRRGPWLGLLFLGIVGLGAPLARRLPRVATPPRGAALGWRWFLGLAVVPAMLTPLIAVQLPDGFLPIIVGDYLALHFLVYGALTAGGLAWAVARGRASGAIGADPARLGLAALAVAGYATFVLGGAFDRYATSFTPGWQRLGVMPAMMAATLVWFLADEWLTRRGPRGAYWITKALFLGSLAGAIALDLERLFFLIIVTPVILIFFLVYGLWSGWTMRATGHPWVAGAGLALALGYAIAVTFPMLSV